MAQFLQTDEDAWDVPALAAAARRRSGGMLQGMASGAQTGASAGSAGGPWGSLIGGVAGAAGGALGSAMENGDDESKRQQFAQFLQGKGPYAQLVQTGIGVGSKFFEKKK